MLLRSKRVTRDELRSFGIEDIGSSLTPLGRPRPNGREGASDSGQVETGEPNSSPSRGDENRSVSPPLTESPMEGVSDPGQAEKTGEPNCSPSKKSRSDSPATTDEEVGTSPREGRSDSDQVGEPYSSTPQGCESRSDSPSQSVTATEHKGKESNLGQPSKTKESSSSPPGGKSMSKKTNGNSGSKKRANGEQNRTIRKPKKLLLEPESPLPMANPVPNRKSTHPQSRRRHRRCPQLQGSVLPYFQPVTGSPLPRSQKACLPVRCSVLKQTPRVRVG